MRPLQETRCTSMELNEYHDSPTGFGNEAGFFVRLNCRCAAPEQRVFVDLTRCQRRTHLNAQ